MDFHLHSLNIRSLYDRQSSKLCYLHTSCTFKLIRLKANLNEMYWIILQWQWELWSIIVNHWQSKLHRIYHASCSSENMILTYGTICRNYSGPQMSSPTDMRSSSQRNYSKAGMAPGYEFADDDSHSKYMSDHSRNKTTYDRDVQDSEVTNLNMSRSKKEHVVTVSYWTTDNSRWISSTARHTPLSCCGFLFQEFCKAFRTSKERRCGC